MFRSSIATLGLCLGVAFPAVSAVPAETSQRPNFVLFVADDLGYTDLGCYGSSFYETPHIDRLAAGGVRFTNAYATCPVCSPSRVSLMTGKYPARLSATEWFGGAQPDQKIKNRKTNHKLLPASYNPFLAENEVTIAEALKESGYTTFMAGKWHLGEGEEYAPENQGFDINKGGYRAGHPPSYFSPYNNPKLSDGPDGEYLTDRISSETAAFIRNHHDKPFFVYLPFYQVHIPLQPRPDLMKKYEAKRRQLGLNDEFTSEGTSSVRTNHSLPEYAAMVEAMDEGVGTVLKALDEAGVSTNTVVMFTSDNGGLSTSQGLPTSNLPLRGGKGWMFEGGIRVPLIVKWPGVTKPGSVSEAVVTGTDFYPTMLAMAGLSARPQQHLDGIDLTTHLRSQEAAAARDVYWHYPHYANQGDGPASCVRSGDWKLIKRYDDESLQLYDLAADLSEKNDLAAENPEKVDELSAKLEAWLKEVDARYPTPNPDYIPAQQ